MAMIDRSISASEPCFATAIRDHQETARLLRRLDRALQNVARKDREVWRYWREIGAVLLDLKGRHRATQDFGRVLTGLGIAMDSRLRAALLWLADLDRQDSSTVTSLIEQFPRSRCPRSLQSAHTRSAKSASPCPTPEVRDSEQPSTHRCRPERKDQDKAMSSGTEDRTVLATIDQVVGTLDAAIAQGDWSQVRIARDSLRFVMLRCGRAAPST